VIAALPALAKAWTALRRAPGWVWPALAAAGLVAALWLVWAQRDAARAEAADWRARHAVAAARLEQVEDAARIHREHIERAEREAARWRQIAEDLQILEGADAPLSPYLRAVLDRVR
jgi:hypothetical protein